MSNWAFQILDSAGTNKAKVNSDGSVFITGMPAAAGGTFDSATASKFMIVDERGEPPIFGYEGRVDTTKDMLLFNDGVEGNALDFRKWTSTTTTMTIAQASGVITLNNSAITTINTAAQITSHDQFITYHEADQYFHARVRPTNLPITNATAEVGFGTASGTSAPTDGAFFRWKSDNTFRCVTNFGGSETGTESAAQTAPVAGDFAHMEILWNADRAIFMWESPYGTPLELTIRTPSATASLTSAIRQPIYARVYTAGVAPGAAPQLGISEVAVYGKILDLNQTYNMLMAGIGNAAYQSPVTAFGQTANWTNAAAPTTRALSNTVASETTLGGFLRFTPTTTADNDYAMFAYTVPAGWRLFVTMVAYNGPYFFSGTGAATARVGIFGIGVNSTADSLATADSVGPPLVSVAYRRLTMGFFFMPAAPTLLTNFATQQANGPYIFDPPLCVESARRFAFIYRALNAVTAGASEVHHINLLVNGYFE